MKIDFKALLGGLCVSVMLAAPAVAGEKVIIGHFGGPAPFQMLAHEGKLSAATGWDIDWRKFGNGTDVIAAMASGDIKLSELGSSPFAIAATQGVDIEAFMLDFVIGDGESLVVRDGTGIKTLADLKGKRVATPVGSTAHFSLMGALKHAGIKQNQLTIMNMPPDQELAAWKQGSIDAAYIWPPQKTEMLKNGKQLVGGVQVAKWGYPTFNVWVVNKKFAAEHKAQLIAFMKAIDKANKAYLKDPSAWTADSPQVKAIADQTGAAAKDVPDTLKGYTFLTLKEQEQPQWMGGNGIAKATKDTAAFLKGAGRVDKVIDDYSGAITDEYIKDALK